MAHRGITSFLRHDTPDGGPASLAQALDGRVREGELVERRPDGAVRCFACGHRCLVKPGRRGICKVRFNRDGTLFAPAGYVAALQCDPTEKKPFFVDLASLLSIDLLARFIHQSQMTCSGDTLVSVTEMLPDPDHLWLSDSAGNRYTSELRLVAVDQSPA